MSTKRTAKEQIRLIIKLLHNSKRILKMVWERHPKMVFITLALSLGIALMPFVKSGVMALLVNNLSNLATADSVTITWLSVLAVAMILIPELLYGFKGYTDRWFGIDLHESFKIMFITKRASIDIATFEDPKFNDILNTLWEHDVWPFIDMARDMFMNLPNILGVIIASFVLYVFNPWLFLIVALAVLPRLFVELMYGQGVYGIFNAEAPVRRRFWALQEHFFDKRDLMEMKLFQNGSYFIKMISDIFHAFNLKQKLIEKKKVLWHMSALTLTGGAIGGGVVMVINSVLAGKTEVGTMVFIIASIIELESALAGFLMNMAGQYKNSLFASDLFKILDAQSSLPKAKNPFKISSTCAPRILFQNVSFAYPGTSKQVLSHISFAIEPGEKLALVGINGAGKTTLVKLLCRIYDPTEGQILVDGRDLRELDLDSWLHALGVLFQDYSSYKFKVAESIALGRTDVPLDMDRVKWAAQGSEASEFINEWEDGYEQMLGKQFDKGIDPSKGQLQKLALARALYRNPAILVLDEPTASVDAESEAKIFARLEALPKDKTVILISHRFSTVRTADKILVLKDGTVHEIGSHTELMEKDGTYARLFKLQAKGYFPDL
jgi:ATP-binding cassette subfamily B protein